MWASLNPAGPARPELDVDDVWPFNGFFGELYVPIGVGLRAKEAKKNALPSRTAGL